MCDVDWDAFLETAIRLKASDSPVEQAMGKAAMKHALSLLEPSKFEALVDCPKRGQTIKWRSYASQD